MIAFVGEGQKAHFDDIDYSGFANVDPAYSKYTMDDELIVSTGRMCYRLAKGFLGGMLEAMGLSELNATAVALMAGLGIAIAVGGALSPPVIAGVIGTLFGILLTLSSAYGIAKAAGGIYSTATGTESIYDKAEAFAHDTAVMIVCIFYLKAGVSLLLKNLPVVCEAATQKLAGRSSRLNPAEAIETTKGADLVASFEEFAEYVKGFLEEDAWSYVQSALSNDANDVSRLRKIVKLLEEGQQRIGKKLSKDEVKAGLDALCEDGGVEGALAAIERVFQSNDSIIVWDKITATAENINNTEIPATFQMEQKAKLNYENPETGTNVLWANSNAIKHMGEYVSRFGEESHSIGIRSQLMLESFCAALNEAMESIISNPPDRYVVVYGNWEIGINTRTGVVFHALMIK